MSVKNKNAADQLLAVDPAALREITITNSVISCPCCQHPLLESDKAFNGIVINRINSLRAELVTVLEQNASLLNRVKGKNREAQVQMEILLRRFAQIKKELWELNADCSANTDTEFKTF